MPIPISSTNWFESWFDSPYYAMLYQHRNQSEAAFFINQLIRHLDLPDRARILDLACGKGRHSAYFAERGYRVVGIDLSASSISAASQLTTPDLKFLRADMRTFDLGVTFDLIVNLFTSFGYFSSSSENSKVLRNVATHLHLGGHFVLDYFNAEQVRKTLIREEEKSVGEIHFRIFREIEQGIVVKRISFHDRNQDFEFEERVQLFDVEELKFMLDSSGLQVLHTFGDYALNAFDLKTSDRVVLIAQKSN